MKSPERIKELIKEAEKSEFLESMYALSIRTEYQDLKYYETEKFIEMMRMNSDVLNKEEQ